MLRGLQKITMDFVDGELGCSHHHCGGSMPVGTSAHYDYLRTKIQAGQYYEYPFMKTSSAPEAAGVWHSLWTAAGYPGAGSAPAATPGTSYDDTAGSIFFPDNASQKYVTGLQITANQNCVAILMDRLVAVSAISLASTGNKTVNSSTVPRYTGTAAAGNMAFCEVTTVTATTAPNVDMFQYTNEAGTTGRAGPAVAFPAAATNVDCLIPLPLQAGDRGVRSVETLDVNTAAASGVCSILIARPLHYIGLVANITTELDMFAFPQIFDGASLQLALIPTGTTAVVMTGKVTVTY